MTKKKKITSVYKREKLKKIKKKENKSPLFIEY
jgi:hypothetical protein